MASLRLATKVLLPVLAVSCAGSVCAQDYPGKPIRIVASLAGGSGDFVARLVGGGISNRFGQPVVVDNRPTNLTGEIVAKAPADGYTLLSASSSLWIGPLLERAPYEIEQFAPVTMVGRSPLILVVHPSVAAGSVKELIALAKAKPGVLNYSAGGGSGPSSLAPELFKSMAGVNMVRIGYGGGAQMLTAVVGGEVQLYFTSPTAGMPQIKAGKLRALGITSAEPSALTPGIPPIAAAGLPGFEVVAPDAIFVPANTPPARIELLYQEIARHIATPEVKTRMLNVGMEPVGNPPKEFAAMIKTDIPKWVKVIKEAGIKVQ